MKTVFSIRGLPILGGPDFVEDGVHPIDEFSDPVTRVTIQNGYLTVKDNEIIAYGLKPHVNLWSKQD